MKTPAAQPSDGLEWLRAIRRDLQRILGSDPRERAAHYQAKEIELRERVRSTGATTNLLK